MQFIKRLKKEELEIKGLCESRYFSFLMFSNFITREAQLFYVIIATDDYMLRNTQNKQNYQFFPGGIKPA